MKYIPIIMLAFIVSAASAQTNATKKDTVKAAYVKTVTVSIDLYQYLMSQVAAKKDLFDYIPNDQMSADDKLNARLGITNSLLFISKNAKLDSVKVAAPLIKK